MPGELEYTERLAFAFGWLQSAVERAIRDSSTAGLEEGLRRARELANGTRKEGE